MRRLLYPVVVGVVLLVLMSIWSFSPPKETLQPSKAIGQTYVKYMAEFHQKVERLYEIGIALENEADVEAFRAAVIDARNAYKEVEFLAAYLDEEFTLLYINGAPLPKIDPQTEEALEKLEPEGLQIIEELAFSDEILEEKAYLHARLKKIKKELPTFVAFQKQQSSRISDRMVFEALRSGIIRIITLGITGFDTPASGNAMTEAAISFSRLYATSEQYLSILEERNEILAASLRKHFEDGVGYLKANQDFDTFDRMHFIRTYANPIYGELLDAHMALGYPTMREALPASMQEAVNYFNRDIFSTDFLSASYYVNFESGEQNPIRIELGRMLFYDPVLSDNNDGSCASCHDPKKAFTDGKVRSVAMNKEGTVSRNSPSLVNVAFADRFFHDLRSRELESQVEHVVFNQKEFNTTFIKIANRLRESPEYVEMFNKAFPGVKKYGDPVGKHGINSALASYVSSLNALNSPVDQYLRGEKEELDESIKRGFNLFMGKAACATCHFAPVFNGTVPPKFHESEGEVLGVPTAPDTANATLDDDPGRQKSGFIRDNHPIYLNAFKTPTVRNIEMTGPYMHNGVYTSLEQVMDFYNRGGGYGIGIELENQTLPPDPLGLTQQEITDVINFMEALTDTVGLVGAPGRLPSFPEGSIYHKRPVGGTY
ncbi:MAG: cytochrome c peroxidase [Bacteroidota bacterium]